MALYKIRIKEIGYGEISLDSLLFIPDTIRVLIKVLVREQSFGDILTRYSFYVKV